MVLMNASKKSRNLNSIVNQNQGGGDKKAGLAPSVMKTTASTIAFRNRGLPKSRLAMTITLFPKVHQSRPIDGRPVNYTGGI